MTQQDAPDLPDVSSYTYESLQSQERYGDPEHPLTIAATAELDRRCPTRFRYTGETR